MGSCGCEIELVTWLQWVSNPQPGPRVVPMARGRRARGSDSAGFQLFELRKVSSPFGAFPLIS